MGVVYLALSCPHVEVSLASGVTFRSEIVKESAQAVPSHWFAILMPSMTKPRISILSKLASWNAVRNSPSANRMKCPKLK